VKRLIRDGWPFVLSRIYYCKAVPCGKHAVSWIWLAVAEEITSYNTVFSPIVPCFVAD